MFKVTPAWKAAFPNAHLPWVLVPGCAGVLVMRDAQPASLESLTRRKQEIEAQLREQYQSSTSSPNTANPILEAYAVYYKRFHHPREECQKIPCSATLGGFPLLTRSGAEDWAQSFAAYIYPGYFDSYQMYGVKPGSVRYQYVERKINENP